MGTLVSVAGHCTYPAAAWSSIRISKPMHPTHTSVSSLTQDVGRCYEDLEREAQPGGALASGGKAPLRPAQRFSLRNWRDLTEDCPPSDIDEMRAVVLATLEEIDGAISCQLGFPTTSSHIMTSCQSGPLQRYRPAKMPFAVTASGLHMLGTLVA